MKPEAIFFRVDKRSENVAQDFAGVVCGIDGEIIYIPSRKLFPTPLPWINHLQTSRVISPKTDLPTIQQLYIIAYYKDDINQCMIRHNGELLEPMYGELVDKDKAICLHTLTGFISTLDTNQPLNLRPIINISKYPEFLEDYLGVDEYYQL